MHWNKKTYARELKKGYWDLEPHFHYYKQQKFFQLFRTILDNDMNLDDWNSAMYGEFVKAGKPILSGFYSNMNFMELILKQIIMVVVK